MSGTLEIDGNDKSFDLLREETLDEDEGSEECDKNPTRRYSHMMLGALLLAGQWMIHISLKHHIVRDHVMPQLQQQIDNGLKWSHSFNETPFWHRFNQSVAISYLTQERLRPGFQMASEGARGKYPVVMIPGFVTSGLEVWEGKECAKKYFRQRMWGGVGSVQQWLMERHCVMEHLTLDPITGKDPEGIRIRAAQGFEAADYFMGNYWVWGKILESLADVGYDGNIMSMESYDWRLSFPKLEERDGFFTKLKYKIEAFNEVTGKKVVLTSHSLGVLLCHYFFAWVSDQDPDWVENHIHAYINIAGAHLGLPKAASALLSGEMSDTIFMGAVGTLVEQFIGRKIRRDLWASWGSLWHMLPKGGDDFWNVLITMTDGEGNVKKNQATDDDEWDLLDEKANVDEAIEKFGGFTHHSSSRIVDFLGRLGGGYQKETEHKVWHDASTTPLPKAPSMKVYCLYGVGIETERAYYYKRNQEEGINEEPTNPNAGNDPPFVVDTIVEDTENNIRHGVQYTDGDGTVPLESLGYMCVDGWRRRGSGLNPSRIPIVTREYEHREEFIVEDPMRRGPHSGDHVDILGHDDVLTDLIRIVTDQNVDQVKDNIISNIQDISRKINTRGGVTKRLRIQRSLKRWRAKLRESKLVNQMKKIRFRSQ